ncbi:hypothetical protein FRC11_011560 [Ceratobasidium sp. 423]|nr:hypothetical protein FRC11_011560 [Ceratobasidium sp. 423]
MSQVRPNGEWHSMHPITKLTKQELLDEQKATKNEEAAKCALVKQTQSETAVQAKAHQAEEHEHVELLKAQAEVELESAATTVEMMYDIGDLAGLDPDDPNYNLIRKIAHLTGNNYASQGLTREELQETLDDLEADITSGKGSLNPPNNKPPFMAFYPGLKFGSVPELTSKSKSFSGSPKHTCQHLTNSPSLKKQTPQQPIKLQHPSSSTRLGILTHKSQPAPRLTSTRSLSMMASKTVNQLALSRSASSPPHPPHTTLHNPSSDASTPSHPGSPALSDCGSPPTGVSGLPMGPKASFTPHNPTSGKESTSQCSTSNLSAPCIMTNTSPTSLPSLSSCPTSELIAEFHQVHTNLKAALVEYQLHTDGWDNNAPTMPKTFTMAMKVRWLRIHLNELTGLINDSPTHPPQLSNPSIEANPHIQNSEHGKIPSNHGTSHTTSAPRHSASSHAMAPPMRSPPATTTQNSNKCKEDDDNESHDGDGKGDDKGKGKEDKKYKDEQEGGCKDEGDDGEDDINMGNNKDFEGNGEGDNGHVHVCHAGPAHSKKDKANKPILRDFPSKDVAVLRLAKAYLYKAAWKRACREVGVNWCYHSIFGKWMKQQHAAFIYESAHILKCVADEYFKFVDSNPAHNMSISKANSESGCHHELHYVINGYRSGVWSNARLNAGTQGAFMCQFLKEYEEEENLDENNQAHGERYWEIIYETGKVAYDA